MSWDKVKHGLAQQLASTLQNTLPRIGGADWWNICVIDNLSPPQQEVVAQKSVTALNRLDLAALLRVCERNWWELNRQFGFPPEGRAYLGELRNVRNKWAHETVEGISQDEILRDLDTALRFVRAIDGSPDLAALLEQEKRSILQRVASGGMFEEDGRGGAPGNGGNGAGSGRNNSQRATAVHRRSFFGDLSGDPQDLEQLRELLTEKTFIGIDFGTSTTVASLITIDENASALAAEPIMIAQSDELDRERESHLVPSCLAWKGGRFLFGLGAADLKTELIDGHNVWSSFKMGLGTDLGPIYFQTVLKEGGPGPTIERPQDAAREFLRRLRLGIENQVERCNLPPEICYAVSVPASFEANQRRDLIEALRAAGISIGQSCLIDEPNAAFFSYLNQSAGAGFGAFLERESRRVLVFDFGAGTCDISILEVALKDRTIVSMNRSVSRFYALGGDDIDRAIVERILIPQLLTGAPEGFHLTTDVKTRVVIPRLMPAAERLKIQCSKMLATRGVDSPDAARRHGQPMTEHPIKPINVGDVVLRLERPSIDMAAFVDVMTSFLAPIDDPETSTLGENTRVVSIFAPIENALRKAGMEDDDLHAVLFIGGSSANPLVQGAVRNRFGRFVELLVPSDLRSHVSQGAALHALMLQGLNLEVIRPISSEPVFVVTAGGGLEEILPAGTPAPSAEVKVSQLTVQRDGQRRVELPICVSNENKLLAVICIDARGYEGFRKEDAIEVTCSLTQDKLLRVKVRAGEQSVDTSLLNPLANRELTSSEMAMLKAQQRFNESALRNRGRPEVPAVIALAHAAERANEYVIAAEMFEAAERLDPARNFATMICYCWSGARRTGLSDRWAEIAFDRDPDGTTAYNLALAKRNKGDDEGFRTFMEEAIRLDPENSEALIILGTHLHKRNAGSGLDLVERGMRLLEQELDADEITEDECRHLERAAAILGRPDLSERARSRRIVLSQIERAYEDDNLASGSNDSRSKPRS